MSSDFTYIHLWNIPLSSTIGTPLLRYVTFMRAYCISLTAVLSSSMNTYTPSFTISFDGYSDINYRLQSWISCLKKSFASKMHNSIYHRDTFYTLDPLVPSSGMTPEQQRGQGRIKVIATPAEEKKLRREIVMTYSPDDLHKISVTHPTYAVKPTGVAAAAADKGTRQTALFRRF